MTSVKLKFREPSAPGKEGSIYFQLIHDRVVKQIKTNLRLYANEWDKERGCIVKTSVLTESRKKEVNAVRERARWELQKLEYIVASMETKRSGYDVDDVMKQYQKTFSESITVFGYMEHQINRLDRLGRQRTAECYRATLNSLRKFRHGIDLCFDMLDADMAEQYEAYLRHNGLCRNTTSYYFRNLRSIRNKAVKEGIAEELPVFENVYTGVDKTSKRAIGLNEIRKIKYVNLSGDKYLDFARDIFLFSFYTRGMSFIDIAYLRKKNISNGYLTYSRKKTGQQLTIKWKDEMRDIVAKYDRPGNPYLFPIIRNKDGDERKQYLSTMAIVNRKLKQLTERAGLPTSLTMYVARHSWASIARDKHVPTSVISKGMGHDSEMTTEIYLASIRNDKVDQANDRILRAL